MDTVKFIRGKSFSIEEDQALCSIWLDISQDPILGKNKKKDKLWERVAATFGKRNPSLCVTYRSPKSLQCRMTLIVKAVSKFRGCIRQVERLNPSGASELDIIKRAKVLFSQDSDEKKGFIFDHVWFILKDAEKWTNTNSASPAASKGSQTNMSQGSETGSPLGPRSIDMNIDDDERVSIEEEQTPINESSSRPTGRKKEKMKKKQFDKQNSFIESLAEENREILKTLKRGQEEREKETSLRYNLLMLNAENEKKKLELEAQRQDMLYMEKDLNSITDPIEREYFRKKKEQVLNKSSNSEVFGSSSQFMHNNFPDCNQYQTGYQCEGGSSAAYYGASGYGGTRQGGHRFGDDLPEY